jgi:predicted nucleotidyltransferase component of viral defense system
VTNPNPTNLQASVRQRLKNIADTSGRPFAEVLQWYAIERFLARFAMTPHRDVLLLKGAALLRAWEADPARPTMDIDLGIGRILSVEEATAVVIDCLTAEIEPDGLEFDLGSVRGEPIRIAQEYPGVRVRCRGVLGTARFTVQIDIGFGDVVVPEPVEIQYPALLGNSPPRVRGYRLETVVAEKLEAIISLGVRTSRMKDYFDLWWLLQNRSFEGGDILRAILTTFERRQTRGNSGVPAGLSQDVADAAEKRRQWDGFIRRMRFDEQPTSFSEAVSVIREFAVPVLVAVSETARFDKRWTAAQGWR